MTLRRLQPEILRLRERIDELQAQLDNTAQQRPEGSEQLAHGNDEYELNFDVNFVGPKGAVVWESVYWVPASWDTIFRAAIAPHMIDRASESEIELVLERAFRHELEELAKDDEDFKAKTWDDVPELEGVSLKNEDLKTIIVQFRALGLITHAERKRSPRDSAPYWTLTRLGDQTMTRLRAIRKSEAKPPKEVPETETEPDGTPSGK